MIKHINFDWKFITKRLDDAIYKLVENGEDIDIPHANKILPIQYANEYSYQFESTYQKTFFINTKHLDQIIIVRFEGVAHKAEVYVNGNYIGTHLGGYTPFEFDITKSIYFDRENLLTIFVDANESLDIPPFGNVVDYLTFGGIYREVSLLIKNETYIKDVYIKSKNLLSNPKITFDLLLSKPFYGELTYQLFYKDHLHYEDTIEINDQNISHSFLINGLKLWDIDEPNLYNIIFKLNDHHKEIDSYELTTGFREAYFTNKGFYLNNKLVKLVGLNRHQDFPYVGYAMPKSAQVLDASILKNSLNLNIVRTSHYPQSKHFINACDELGLLVFEEIPGWQHIGKSSWKDVSYENLRSMILRDRNNPSIILWGVRVNESPDDDEFYEKTNEIAHQLDPNRQTIGVRFLTNGSVQEDVLGLNDFNHDGISIPLRKKSEVTKHNSIPYLVTEHNGHMFPTKSYDPESKRLEHSKRHLNVINHMLSDEDITGVIGWCMHDYYTHKDFGSGDRICHHGVLDMFRNEKMAAMAYQSQNDVKPYLKVSTTFNIGEHPKGFIEDALVFTNCDRVDVYRNDFLIGSLKKDLSLKNLKHPPFVMDWLCDLLITQENLSLDISNQIKMLYKPLIKYGLTEDIKSNYSSEVIDLTYKMYGKYIANWGTKNLTYTFKGYMNNDLVIETKQGGDVNRILKVYSDTNVLSIKETYDVVRITVELVNEFNERLVYSNDVISVETDHNVEVIGDTNMSLIGGVRSFWVKTKTRDNNESQIKINHQNQIHVIKLKIIKEDNQ